MQRLTLLSHQKEKPQDRRTTDHHHGIGNQKEEFDKTQMKDSLHGQQEGAEDASSHSMEDAAELSKDVKEEVGEGKEHETQPGKLFIHSPYHKLTYLLFSPTESLYFSTLGILRLGRQKKNANRYRVSLFEKERENRKIYSRIGTREDLNHHHSSDT